MPTKRTFLKTSAAGALLRVVSALADPVPQNGVATRTLADGWQFREAGSGDWLKAAVPGTVHTDLLAAGKIPDPFYRTNERDLQWIDKKDWEYCTTLDIDAATLAHEHVELVFLGLDTFADVFVNDALVLKADNMFRRWTVDIKAQVKPGTNELRIVLRSPVQEGLKRLAAHGYPLPAVVDWSEIGGLGDKHVSMFVRKAGYHFGWDWGPRFVTSGIWRPVELRAWSGVRIDDLAIVQNSVTAHEARVTAVFEILADAAGPAVVEIAAAPAITARQTIDLKPGLNVARLNLTIAKPRLWWSNGLGEAHLYEFSGQVVAERGRDSKSVKTGLRTVKLVQKPDADGTSFYIELNGVPVFMKGANYIPNDNFLPRVSHADYDRVVKSAADTHMNMLRVWGGGIYENDEFYDLCDRHGILIWQDFMFACTMYPGDQAFLDSIRAEAIDNIRRLRGHASIALWCGNNEIDTAWQNDVPNGGWKWKESYSEAQRAELWATYSDIFHKILPQAVAEHDPARFYWPSSPLSAWDGKDGVKHADLTLKQQSGDIHSWGVWWAQRPFSSYRTFVGRFMSEYGFQSFPELKTIAAFAEPGDYDIFSDVMKAHQRSSIGNGTIRTYMERDYKVPKDFRQFLYVGQVLQAEGIKIAMEAHRARKPFCMGSLFWQINDCWPVASWSSIDYYGRWKALQYFARKSYAPELVTASVESETLRIAVVSDRLKDRAATLTLTLMDFRGNVLKTAKDNLVLPANGVVSFSMPMKNLLADASPNEVLLHASLAAGTAQLAEDILYFAPVKDLALPVAPVAVTTKPAGDGLAIALHSPVLVKNLYLSFNDADGFFSDNYFDLLPNTTKAVHFKPAGAAPRQGLKLMHMAEIT
jgi:beta-mannosidase